MEGPCVLIATESTTSAEGSQAGLARRGVAAQTVSDRVELDRWIAEPGNLDAVVCDISLATVEDLLTLTDNAAAIGTTPATVLVIPPREPMRLAEAVSAGVTLPIIGHMSAEPIIQAVHALLDLNVAPDGDHSIWELDPVAWQITPASGATPVPLSFKEREFLLKLARQPGQPLAKEAFVGLFNTTAELFDPRRLEIMVRRLRNKVRDYAKTELPLHTAHGLGYALATPVKVKGEHAHSGGPWDEEQHERAQP